MAEINMEKSVVVDSFPESALRYRDTHAIVVVDVYRFTTTVTTALALGRRVYPVQTTDQAFVKASTLVNPMLVGELGGHMPYDFDLSNSPAEIATRTDVRQPGNRPIVIVSSSGSQLLMNAHGSEAVYVSCLRNFSALAEYVHARHKRIAVLGAGTHGQFRREDQYGCALVAERLVKAGFRPESEATTEIIKRWSVAELDELRSGRSAAYLERSGQARDIEFTLSHVDDLRVVPILVNDEVVIANKDDLVA
jgi:2-phosphosulfolactate phosphatase